MLEGRSIDVRFGGVHAVAGVSVEVHDGEALGLVGPNGSGKTTLLNALTGVVPAQGGLWMDGRALAMGQPRAINAAGISRVFQAPQVFPFLSCLENVLLAGRDRRRTGYLAAIAGRPAMMAAERDRWRRANETLESVGLIDVAMLEVDALTYGQQRLLEIARGVFSKPRVLLLDEPSAGLNDRETDALASVLEWLRGRDGVSLVIVDHKLGFVERLCPRLLVMDFGRVIARGTPDEVWQDPAVVEAYLGVEAADA